MNSTEKYKGFSYEFTMRELWYFLFRKKECPCCGGHLTRYKDFETVKGSYLNRRPDDHYDPDMSVKKYSYFYSCGGCGTVYPLSDLATR